MEREKRVQEQSQKSEGNQQKGEPSSLQKLKVQNEKPILPVKFAGKSGCGACG